MLTVHIPGQPRLYQPHPRPGWRLLGEVERDGDDAEGVASTRGALALSPTGLLAQLGAGAVHTLDQGEARRALVCAIGPLLYGPDWQVPLSRALGVNDRTVRRWVAGEARPAEGVLADVLRLARERAAVLAELAG